MKRLICIISVTLCLTGCFTIEKCPAVGGGEHVVMNNYGWQLFDCLPLWCGNASEKSSMAFALFRDDVTVEKIQERFAKYANGRDIECPMYDISEEKKMSIFGIPIPYLYTYREITLSGTIK